MKKSFSALTIMVLITFSGLSQGFSSFITYLNSLPEDQRMAAVDSFMTAVTPDGFPYITADTAHFIYRGNATVVQLAGDFNGWDPGSSALTKVSGTDFYYLSMTFEMNARLDYKFVINGSTWILDPLNPNTCSGGFGPNSELAMPEYVQPWEIGTYPNVQHGTVVTGQIASTFVNKTFQLKIYLPAGYSTELPGGYPVVYFQDGYEYISLGYGDKVLDNLIDSNLCCPVIGVFVRPNNRNDEYAGELREEYRQFFAEELVPYIDGEYNTIAEARARAVIGDSYGGNISALIAYHHAGLFGNCGLHSAAFQPNGYEAYNLVVNGEVKPIRWASVWGTYEPLWDNMRDFRDFLTGSGYDLTWLELHEGHSWGLWRATIDVMVPFFFPPEFLGTGERINPVNNDVLIYPNPMKDRCTCIFSLNKPDLIIIRLISGSGEIVYQSIKSLTAGKQTLTLEFGGLPAGIYILCIQTGQEKRIKKFTVN